MKSLTDRASSLDRLSKALGKDGAAEKGGPPKWGTVKAVNADGSYQVRIDGDVEDTKCAPCCLAAKPDRVVVAKVKGHNVALGSVGDAEVARRLDALENAMTEHHTAGGSYWPSGIVYFDKTSDGSRFSVHGNFYFMSGSDAWSGSVSIPGGPSGTWAIKTPFIVKAPAAAKAIHGAGFVSTVSSALISGNLNRLTLVIGTDGCIYIHPMTANPGSGALAGHVFVFGASPDDFPDY